MPAKRLRLRRFLWRWHRRLGLVVAIFVLLLAVTGIWLNHASRLGADRAALPPALLSLFYGIEAQPRVAFRAGGDWLVQFKDQSLYWNQSLVGGCDGPLLGMVVAGDWRIAACANTLLLLTPTGEVVEKVGPVHGLPSPLTAVGRCGTGEAICFRVAADTYRLDLARLQWQLQPGAGLTASQPLPLPEGLSQTLRRQHTGQGITWERFLLDLHSGRLFGSLGIWLMDGVALLFMVLALSGVWLWFAGRR